MRFESPILFCFCAPAGSGKSTVCRRLAEEDRALMRSISTTTREPRDGEIDGVHYHFVSLEEFNARVEQGLFIEHATFGGNQYGTERRNVDDAAAAGKDLLLAIDVQGVQSLKNLHPKQVVCVFLFPPSFEVLAKRLEERGTEDLEVRKRRLRIARDEIETLCAPGFSDYLLINDELDQAVKDAHSVLSVERMRFERLSAGRLKSIFSSAKVKAEGAK